jgi:hypothetical protein
LGGQGGQQQAKGLGRVKNTYASVAEYLAVFEPLLFEEVKAQIVQGRSDEEEGGWVGGAPDFVLPPQFAVGLFNSVCVCVLFFSPLRFCVGRGWAGLAEGDCGVVHRVGGVPQGVHGRA